MSENGSKILCTNDTVGDVHELAKLVETGKILLGIRPLVINVGGTIYQHGRWPRSL